MKKDFSPSWKNSRQPRKQRKYLHNAPLHILHKFFSASLSKELRKKYGVRNLPVRKGDLVVIISGAFRKKEGKVEKVLTKRGKVQVAGVHLLKSDGKQVPFLIHPSNLRIKELELSDKKRKKALTRKNPKAGGKDNAPD